MSAVAPVVHARVEPELKQYLADRARANDRSEAAELRLILHRHRETERFAPALLEARGNAATA